ncbi:MAG: Uma2 family endonuclease [Geminicoccaceae bacterium]
MTVAEFLAWDDGTDTRYELMDGRVIAMAPPSTVHATIAQNVGELINRHLAGRAPCRAMQAAGVALPDEHDTVYVPDVLLTCEPLDRSPLARAPRLIVEVLSPSTKGIDQKRKVPAYGRLPTVEEIWLVASDERWVLVWSRVGETWVAGLPSMGSALFGSQVLGGDVALDQVYRLTGID